MESREFEIVNQRKAAKVLVEESAFSGVMRVASKLVEDIGRASMAESELLLSNSIGSLKSESIVIATVGKSNFLDLLDQKGMIDLSKIRGKREVYLVQIIKNPFAREEKGEHSDILLIAGSDKRGTIYGIFHISEILGVSPWYYFADISTVRKERIILTAQNETVSKEPSVKYRGFFINDEWPAFGNWTMDKFGGFTSELYDKVFELLLRLKGNYLWPAMWSSSFSLDGPGLQNAILADEYGVVMCNSHHEPCLRHSEEWDKVKGKDTKYGDKWNYYSNKEGLLNYWEEGLIRNGKFENVITIGMRGERDSTLEGPQTLRDNIELLKDIIENQRKLIAKHINADTSKVPQMLALYKEVEAYFYGDETTEGLVDWDGLEGVTCMLCEDNYGYMRTLPTTKMRDKSCGYGMYYHFDYHGGPVSYEWLNSTYLTKVWEQMTMAYDYGVRDIWVVNVGDLKFQEYPLSFFMDLAYDFDTYGTNARNRIEQYTKEYVRKQYYGWFDETDLIRITDLLLGYTKVLHNRKPEAMNEKVYHPVHFGEADELLKRIDELMAEAGSLYAKAKQEIKDAFFETIFFQVQASLNVIRMQLLAGKNHFYATRGAVIANDYASLVDECIRMDRDLVAQLDNVNGGKWKHMADSMHIGFTNWNDEDSRYPVKEYVEPVSRPRIIVLEEKEETFSTGGDWTGVVLKPEAFLHHTVSEAVFHIYNGGSELLQCRVNCDCEGVTFNEPVFSVEQSARLTVKIDRSIVKDTFTFKICSNGGTVKVIAGVNCEEYPEFHENTACVEAGYAALEARHYADKKDACDGSFEEIVGYGKTLSGMKVFPTTVTYREEGTNRVSSSAPSLQYQFYTLEEGEYEILLYHSPASPLFHENVPTLYYGIQVNEEDLVAVNTVHENYRAGEPGCPEWCMGVLDQIRVTTVRKVLKKGLNKVRVYAVDAGVVLEKVAVTKLDGYKKQSYLGIPENL